MSFIRALIRIPFIIWFVVAGGLGYMDYTTWETETYQPLVASLDTKKNELAIKEMELKKAEEFTKRREEKLQELQDLTLRFEATKAALPRNSSIPTLLKDLADISDNVGLQFSRFRPETERKKAFLVETPISVELKGTYVQIMSFLDGAANIERIVTTEKLNLENPSFRGPAANLTATATLITYYLEEGATHSTNSGTPGQPGQ